MAARRRQLFGEAGNDRIDLEYGRRQATCSEGGDGIIPPRSMAAKMAPKYSRLPPKGRSVRFRSHQPGQR